MSEPRVPESDDGRTVVVYDDTCSFCAATVRGGRAADRRGLLRFVGTSEHDTLRSCGIDPDAPRPKSIIVRTSTGETFSESRAVAEIVRATPLLGPILAPVLVAARPVADPVYRLIARNRHRLRLPFRRN